MGNLGKRFIDAFRIAGDAGYCINNSSVLLKEVHKSPESMSEFTDHVYFDILYSRDPKIEEAKKILQRVFSRKLYSFIGKVSLKVPSENRQVYIKDKQRQLEKELAERVSNTYRVAVFYLDLDFQNDYVSKVIFYRKVRGTNAVEEQSFQNIKELLEPFPFQLTKETTALLLVFCTEEKIEDKDLVKTKKILADFL